MAGIVGGIMKGTGKVYKGISDILGGEEDKEDAEERYEAFLESLNKYQAGHDRTKTAPVFKSDLIGPYEKSKSPLARSYLESMLTGDNPDALNQPWSNQTDVDDARARSSERYGSTDKLLSQSRENESAQPWKTTRPDVRTDWEKMAPDRAAEREEVLRAYLDEKKTPEELRANEVRRDAARKKALQDKADARNRGSSGPVWG